MNSSSSFPNHRREVSSSWIETCVDRVPFRSSDISPVYFDRLWACRWLCLSPRRHSRWSTDVSTSRRFLRIGRVETTPCLVETTLWRSAVDNEERRRCFPNILGIDSSRERLERDCSSLECSCRSAIDDLRRDRKDVHRCRENERRNDKIATPRNNLDDERRSYRVVSSSP